ncbi:MAG: DUF393 domain-containing protein [Pseudomonadota bacterium]
MTAPTTVAPVTVPPLQVFFDGDCPICRFEVDFYARRDAVGRIAWIDITRLDETALPAGKTREDLLNRFHVRDDLGVWHVGVDAFQRIWRELPGFRRVAGVFSVPGLRGLAEIGYRLFLTWQQRDRKRRDARKFSTHA